jgi:mono/diheme cytochrome c family protein
MYRGIIQEGNWVKEGTYLRKVVQQYQLDKNFGRGRIWRLVSDKYKPGPQPKLQKARSSKLVSTLEHPNGWWRDTAQKLLVLRQDKKVVPALIKMMRENKNHLARIHALWTLEGLDALTPDLLREKMKDEHPQVRIAAIRASETLFKQGNKSLVGDVEAMSADTDPSVVIQAMMTAHYLKWKDTKPFIEAVMKKNKSRGVQEIGTQLLVPAVSEGRKFNEQEKRLIRKGENIYNELCFTCHGNDGKGMPLAGAKEGVTMAPPLAYSRTATGISDQIIDVLLKGLNGPVNDKKYDAQMVPMESNDDEWIAAVASYVRNSFKNNASMIRTNDVARIREMFKDRSAPWTLEELHDVIPQSVSDRTNWIVSASDASDRAIKAIDSNEDSCYETGKDQAGGMWYQIEFPEPKTVSGLYLNAMHSPTDFPRGYKVEISDDGKSWDQSVAQGKGDGKTTEIRFAAVKTKFIRIVLTGSSNHPWSIYDLQVLRPADEEKIKAAASKKAEGSKLE